MNSTPPFRCKVAARNRDEGLQWSSLPSVQKMPTRAVANQTDLDSTEADSRRSPGREVSGARRPALSAHRRFLPSGCVRQPRTAPAPWPILALLPLWVAACGGGDLGDASISAWTSVALTSTAEGTAGTGAATAALAQQLATHSTAGGVASARSDELPVQLQPVPIAASEGAVETGPCVAGRVFFVPEGSAYLGASDCASELARHDREGGRVQQDGVDGDMKPMVHQPETQPFNG